MNEEIKIEKGVPIPGKTGRPISGSKYPVASLEIGDSFFIAKPRCKVSNVIRRAVNQSGFTVTTRTVEGGTRIWRIA